MCISQTIMLTDQIFLCSSWNFSKSKKAPPSVSLPRTKKALYLHFNKVNYQFRQWKIALNLHHELSDQTDHVWVNDDNGSLGIHWADCKPVEFVTCSSQNVGHVVGSLLIYHAHICLCKIVRTQTKIQILILKIRLMTTFMTVMTNIMKTSMKVVKKKMVANCF